VGLDGVLNALQYHGSPNFLSGRHLESDRDFGHVFRRAQQPGCNLRGAYVLNAATYNRPEGNVPVVYICEAESESEARQIHRKVWNQNVVPFLLVVSPAWIRLYPGSDNHAVSVWNASDAEAQQLAVTRGRLIEHRAQWLYFSRNLRVYEGSLTYVLKPLQRFHWTRTHAIQDAAEIIADCLEPESSAVNRTN